MEPLTMWAGKAAISKVKDLIVRKVAARWSSYRADVFTAALVDALRRDREEQDTSELDDVLLELLRIDWKSEAIFEAYRRVSLSRSRDLGPCIVALLTAELILEERKPEDSEELIFDAAERLSDAEILEFSKSIREWEDKATTEKPDALPDLYVSIGKDYVDLDMGAAIETSSMMPGLGNWAVKAVALGLISERIEDRTQKMETRYHVGPQTYRTVTFTVYVPAGVRRFAHYVERAQDTLKPGDTQPA
jgi:hypothetical protein